MSQEVTIPGRHDRVIDVCKFVISGARQVGFDEDELFRIELACDEACTNVIEHAYGGDDQGPIRVIWEFDGGAFIITIYDHGRYFDPDSVPKPQIPESPDQFDQLKIGGLGIHFMRSLMDEIRFESDTGAGNKLVMVKYLSENNHK
jgi:serine/threonine-protein kinase RsbW